MVPHLFTIRGSNIYMPQPNWRHTPAPHASMPTAALYLSPWINPWTLNEERDSALATVTIHGRPQGAKLVSYQQSHSYEQFKDVYKKQAAADKSQTSAVRETGIVRLRHALSSTGSRYHQPEASPTQPGNRYHQIKVSSRDPVPPCLAWPAGINSPHTAIKTP